MEQNERILPSRRKCRKGRGIFDGPVRFIAAFCRAKARFLGALMSAALLATTLASCTKQDELAVPAGYGDWTVCFHNESQDEVVVTRGAYTESEMKVSDVNLYVYDARGDLYRQIYTDAIYSTKVRLAIDSTYTILALANVGEVAAERRLEDMRAKTLLPWAGAAAMNEKGEPMAADLRFTATRGMGLYIDLIRLVARYDVMLDQTDMVGRFTVKSLKLCQASDTLVPFVEDSPRTAASSVIAVADSATADDIAKLNAGGFRSFHVSENRQGVLLPDNTDPWKKLPDSIPEKKAVCTYLEMRGDYNDDGITISDMGFRMYLGNDATTDFDIVRNTAYTVTVGIDDKATAEVLSWKVVPGSKDDKRTLSWSPNPDTLFCEKTLTVTPNLGVTQKSTRFDFSFEGLDGLGVTYTRTGNSLKFTSSKQLSEVKKFYVTASTPDGRHSSKLTVVVQPRYPVKLVASCTEESRWMKITESVWKFDWYKINNVEETPSRTVSYTVRATYNDGYEANVTSGAVPSISTSASVDGGGIAIDTRGMIRGAGGHNGYGNGTLKFSYTEHGKTAKCSVEWWRIGVTQVKLPFNNIIIGTDHQYIVSEAMQNVAAVVYNDGSSEMPANAKFYNEHSTMTSTRTDIVNIFHGSNFCYIQGVHTGESNVSCAYSYRGTMFSCSLTVDPRYQILGSDDIRYPPSGDYKLQVSDGSGWVQSTDEISCGSVSGSGSISATDIWNAYHQKGQIVTATIYGGNASKTINIEGEP